MCEKGWHVNIMSDRRGGTCTSMDSHEMCNGRADLRAFQVLGLIVPDGTKGALQGTLAEVREAGSSAQDLLGIYLGFMTL